MKLRFVLLILFPLLGVTLRAAAEEPISFERHIRPILKTHCFHCHGEEETKQANLDVRLKRLLEQGGDSGAAIVPGKPEESLLLQRIVAKEMPPEKKPPVSEAEAALIRQWIAEGATAGPEPENPAEINVITEEERRYWAFQPAQRPPLPAVGAADRLRSPVDAYLLARLEQSQLIYSPEASPAALLRRATFDLVGLPPSPDDVAAFEAVSQTSPDAYERVVDRLLASPAYGERWGRHWLDVAGYADSDGYTVEDRVRPYAYKFRDYVIKSLNADKPWDQMIVEQLAGDELVPLPHQNLNADQTEILAATGFLRMAPDGTMSDPDQKTARNAVVADTLKIVSTSLLGMTVGCAQCHNHRYDPIPQADYYRLRAIFEPALDPNNWRKPSERLVSLYTDADRAKAAQIEAEAKRLDDERQKKAEEIANQILEKELAKLPEEMREAARQARDAPPKERTAEQQALLKKFPSVNVTTRSIELYDRKAANMLKEEAKKAADVRATKPVEDFVSVLSEVPGKVPTTAIFHRGDPDQPKQQVEPGGLAVLGECSPTIPADDPSLPTTGRRLAYAQQLTSGIHPLVGRVLVNRFWMHHFGRGIVASPGDFGKLGEAPSHPELLDWLASEFTSRGWELKRLHRRLMHSGAYRQVSLRHTRGEQIDPDNRLLWRAPVRRLEAEAVRDAALELAGRLMYKQFGPPVPVMIDATGQAVLGIEMLDGEGNPSKKPAELNGEDLRRSVYIQVRRSRPLGTMEAFDLPVQEPNCELRPATTVTPQSLMLMNSEFIAGIAEAMAARLVRDAGDRDAGEDVSAEVTRGWQLAYGRTPSRDELGGGVLFVQEATALFVGGESSANAPSEAAPSPQQRALALFCQTLLSSNEFLYIE